MDAIAKHADVSKQTIYSNFESKENLFQTIMCGYCDSMRNAAFDMEKLKNLDTEEKLKHIGQNILQNILEPEAVRFFRILVTEAEKNPDLVKVFKENSMDCHHQQMQAVLQEETEKGHLKIEDTSLAVDQFYSLLKGGIYIYKLLGIETKPVQEHLEHTVKMFLKVYKS